MNDTARGVVIFLSVLITLSLWVPLRNRPELQPDGTVVTETYFGVFRYGTLRTELKEPKYEMAFEPHYGRIAITAVVTAGWWAGAILAVRRGK